VNINEHLTTVVMGYKHMDAGNGEYWYSYSGDQIAKASWDPRNNIKQAIMCADKTGKRWVLEFSDRDQKYYAEVGLPVKNESISGPTPAAALSFAVARASGWEE
jgi:hypothetical protein